jgi:hypothetical protein
MAYFSKIRCQRLYVGSSSGFASELTSTQTGYLSGVTAGTVTANKALVVDGSKDLSGLNDITCGAIDTATGEALVIGTATATAVTIGQTDAPVTIVDTLNIGSSGNAGVLKLYPATASKGYVTIQTANQTDDTIRPTLNFMEIDTAARTINVPDPGATAYLVESSQANDKSLVNATNVEINKYCDESAMAVIDCTASTLAVTAATHGNKIVTLSRAAGVTATLPDNGTGGTGVTYTFVTATAVTANQNKIIATDTTNTDMVGVANIMDDDGATSNKYLSEQSDGNDYIQSNGTTQGGASPYADVIRVTDIANDVWKVEAFLVCPSGSNPATPFGST